MATAAQPAGKQTAGKKTASSAKASPREPDAIALLKADHREAEELFEQAKAASGAKKGAIVAKVCAALRMHMQIEEEIFYPLSREHLRDDDIVDEAVVEHAAARSLMEELETMKPGDDLYDAKVTVLSEQIEHHVKEEETEYFPRVKKTDMDLKAVGERMAARKAELNGKAAARRQ